MLGTSCGTSSVVRYEYMLPAEVTLPVELASIGVVNHTPDSLYDLSTIVTKVIAEDISDARYFNDVHLLDSTLTGPMTSERVDDLARYLEVDFIASLDTIELSLRRSVEILKENHLNRAKADMNILAKLRLYLPGRSTPMATLLMTDSLRWYALSSDIVDEKYALNNLPSTNQMVYESAVYIGEQFSKKLVPHWTDVTRVLYVGKSRELNEAAVNVHDGDWEKAVKKWEVAYNKTKSKKVKAFCAYNLGVYYEKVSEIDKAIEWITKSAEHFKEIKDRKAIRDITEYLVFLQSRKTEVQLLDLQFAE